MIKQTGSFIASCDHCGETLITAHEGFSLFVDEDSAFENADNEGWYWDDDLDLLYCKECFWIDDEDKMNLRPERKKVVALTPSTNVSDTPTGQSLEKWEKAQYTSGHSETPSLPGPFLEMGLDEVLQTPPLPVEDVPEAVDSWIRAQISSQGISCEGFHGIGARKVVIAMYHQSQQEISSLREQLAEARNDLATYQQWNKEAKQQVASMQESMRISSHLVKRQSDEILGLAQDRDNYKDMLVKAGILP